ncbi:MAG: hypothetical protein JO182_05825 [Acidobacteriaceae bacterium]|nr:hypothetical protein [Acidobacteriaceae bacterium]
MAEYSQRRSATTQRRSPLMTEARHLALGGPGRTFDCSRGANQNAAGPSKTARSTA